MTNDIFEIFEKGQKAMQPYGKLSEVGMEAVENFVKLEADIASDLIDLTVDQLRAFGTAEDVAGYTQAQGRLFTEYTGRAQERAAAWLETSIDRMAPSIALTGTLDYTAKDPPSIIVSEAEITDPDTTQFEGGTLTIDMASSGMAGQRTTVMKDLIAGNWKMHASHLDAIQMIQKLSYRLEPGDYSRVDVVVCPPFTALLSAQTVIETDHLMIGLGAQDGGQVVEPGPVRDVFQPRRVEFVEGAEGALGIPPAGCDGVKFIPFGSVDVPFGLRIHPVVYLRSWPDGPARPASRLCHSHARESTSSVSMVVSSPDFNNRCPATQTSLTWRRDAE